MTRYRYVGIGSRIGLIIDNKLHLTFNFFIFFAHYFLFVILAQPSFSLLQLGSDERIRQQEMLACTFPGRLDQPKKTKSMQFVYCFIFLLQFTTSSFSGSVGLVSVGPILQKFTFCEGVSMSITVAAASQKNASFVHSPPTRVHPSERLWQKDSVMSKKKEEIIWKI